MRRYLLDTPLLAALLYGRPQAVSLIAPWISARKVATSVLCYAEVVEHITARPDYATYTMPCNHCLMGFIRIS